MSSQMINKEYLWKEYDQAIGLYKFYFSLTLQIYIFFYGITGGIVTFYFANKNIAYVQYSLILPMIMSFLIAFLFAYGSKLISVVGNQINHLAKKLNVYAYPNTSVLKIFFIFSSILFVSTGIAMIYLIWAG